MIMDIIELFSTRELAILIWILILLTYLFCDRKLRKMLINLIKVIFSKKLNSIWISFYTYIIFITCLFSKLSLWDNVFIKDVLMWGTFSGIFYCCSVISNNSDKSFIKEILADSFKLIVIVEFLISTFTFNIFIELIILPVITFLFLTSIVANKDEKFLRVGKLLQVVLSYISFIFLLKTFDVVIDEYKNLDIEKSLISFMIPLTYTILSIPYLYFIEIYCRYEVLILRMQERTNYKYKFKLFKVCNFSIKKISYFDKKYLAKFYHEISEKEFDNIFSYFKEDYKQKKVAKRLQKIKII